MGNRRLYSAEMGDRAGPRTSQPTCFVTLGFLEPTAAAAGQRFFNVSANGILQIANLDILGATGAQNTAIARTFLVTVSNGVLALDFTGLTGKAILSNIAAVRQ